MSIGSCSNHATSAAGLLLLFLLIEVAANVVVVVVSVTTVAVIVAARFVVVVVLIASCAGHCPDGLPSFLHHMLHYRHLAILFLLLLHTGPEQSIGHDNGTNTQSLGSLIRQKQIWGQYLGLYPVNNSHSPSFPNARTH